MRETRVLLISLMNRVYGPAITSWIKAIRHAERVLPHTRIDHLWSWGVPQQLNMQAIDSQPGVSVSVTRVTGESTEPAPTQTARFIHTDRAHWIVTHKYMEAVDTFKAGDWPVMITLEDDMIIPEDGITRVLALLKDGADIGYGLYCWRHGAHRWSAYTQVGANRGVSFSMEPDKARSTWGTTQDVAGVGLGFTAIKRHVLDAIHIRRVGGAACNDWYLSMDAQKLGFTQRCDLACVCGHMSLEPSPRIIWPDPAQADLYRLELLP